MKRYNLIFGLFLFLFTSCDQFNLDDTADKVTEALSDEDIISGLKDALNVGISTGAERVSKKDGYFKNTLIKILFPKDAQDVKKVLEDAGFSQLVDDFVVSLNRAAEGAAKKGIPIFVDAITNMTFQDARNILYGADSLGATNFLQTHTFDTLRVLFKPPIKTALDSVYATQYWGDISSTYNTLTSSSITTDLPEYTTQKALSGLFYVVGEEEKKIRRDPVARVTEILKKVFGTLGN